MAASSTLRGLGWCFSMWLPNFWFDVYILSQNLQSYFPMSNLWIWVLLCCLRYLFCVKVFPHVSQLNIITGAFLTFTMSLPQINWCFCKLSFRLYTLSHFSHLNLPSRCVFLCLASPPLATPVSQILHFSIVWTFAICFFSKYMRCGIFFHTRYSWTHSFGGKSACKNEVDCWILFHNRHIDFGRSLLKVRNATKEFVNLQNSKYFRFLKDSKPSFHPNSICYFLLFWQFLGQCD